MNVYIERAMFSELEDSLKNVPAVALLGPRQCGKSTLARHFCQGRQDVLYLDLERPLDLAKLQDPEALFEANADKLVCIDEVQRAPELFTVLRYIIDRHERPGQFLILGSASRDLIRQSSETLAGRIRYLELTPFLLSEISTGASLQDYWIRGGFPRSWLAASHEQSFEWRLDFTRDFLERDIPMLKRRVEPSAVGRLWTMLAHVHGQLLNMSAISSSLGIDSNTVRSYIDLLEGAFIVRRLPPYTANLKKRLVKRPKIYFRDTGLLFAMLGIESWNDLMSYPVFGFSWEGLCIENILAHTKRNVQATFYRTVRGAEIDLILKRGKDQVALEFKVSTAPRISKGFRMAVKDLDIKRAWVISPVDSAFEVRGVRIVSLQEFLSCGEMGVFFRGFNQ